jgi:hypothetical protein
MEQFGLLVQLGTAYGLFIRKSPAKRLMIEGNSPCRLAPGQRGIIHSTILQTSLKD